VNRPTLTIDFKGICAFVADAEKAKDATRIRVAMMDREHAKGPVCPHEPIVVFRLEEDFLTASGPEFHRSVSTADGKNLGFWSVTKQALSVEDVDPALKGSLVVDRTYDEILKIADLNDGDGRVDAASVSKPGSHGVSAILDIDHGRVRALRWSDVRWGIAPETGNPQPTGYNYIRQIVRWEIQAPKASGSRGLRLSNGSDWIQLQKGAHIVISDLCPFEAGDVTIAQDVLAFYPFLKNPLPSGQRNVLYLEGSHGPNSSTPVRPGVDACPPATGVLAS